MSGLVPSIFPWNAEEEAKASYHATMNQFQVSPSEKFTFKADDWPKWIKRFERFRIASGLETQPDEHQVNALSYTMGEEAEDILTSLHLSPEEASEYGTVTGWTLCGS